MDTLPQHNPQNTPGRERLSLSEEHRRDHIEASSIAPPVAEARAYGTATKRSQLEGLVKPYQRRVPALIIPTYSPDGETTSLQVRPDKPRVRNGKAIKYETPADSRCILDVHPSMYQAARDAARPLWITEGMKKADALTSRGECAVALTGVWNWQRDGEPLPCWSHVTLEGREALVVFDSDVMVKPEVQLALERLVAFLQGQGAAVRVVYLPDAPDGSKTGADDYLAAGGTVAGLKLLARPYEARDLAGVRLTRDERLRAGTAELWATWRGMRTVKQGELTDWSLERELIRRAERGGKVVAGGIRVVASVRALALAVGVSTGALLNSLRRLEASGFLRPDNEGRARDKAGAYVLFTSNALRKQDGKETGTGRGGRERETALSDAPYDTRVYVAQHEARPVKSSVPELRYSRAVLSWEYDKRGRRQRVVDPLARIGKKRQAILEHLEERGGVCKVAELMARFAGEKTRPYDFKRRTLAMLTEAPAIIVIEGDVVSLGGKWRESLEHARELGAEVEDERLQAQKYARQREAFRRRDEVDPEPVPDMHPIPDMRTPWPAHPEGCACPSCVKRFGEREGEHVAGCCCADCFDTIKEEAHEAGRRVVPLAARRTRPAKTLPSEAEEHAWHCDCPKCGPEPSYARPFGSAS